MNTATMELSAFDELLDLLGMDDAVAVQPSQALAPDDSSTTAYSFFCCFGR